MNGKLLAPMPLLWGAVASGAINTSTTVTIGIAVAASIFTGALLWRAGRYSQRMESKLGELERKVEWLCDQTKGKR